MDITGIAKSNQANSIAAGKASSKKEWKLSDSLREKITEYAREDAAQNVYMGNNEETITGTERRPEPGGSSPILRFQQEEIFRDAQGREI